MVVPSDYPAALTTFEWWNPDDSVSTIAVNEEKLFSMTHLSKGEMVHIAAGMTIAQIRGDRVAYLYMVRRALGTLGQDGRGRTSIKEIIMGATQKINESVQLHKTKRVLTGRNGQVEERQEQEDSVKS
jgi:hypothetical protein